MSQATLAGDPYLNSNLFSGYYLEKRVEDLEAWNCNEDARAVFDELQTLWNAESNLVDSYKEDELLDSWIDEVLDTLGYGTLSETTLPGSGGYIDRLLFDSTQKRREAAFEKKDGRTEAMYNDAAALLEAKRWNATFTDRFNEQRSYRDASHQVKYYLERTPEHLQWGILTNGRKWRLYGTKNYETQTYYEVDLPELLESGNLNAFKYFYVFFRPDAFRESGGATFLDTVWNESETAAQELGEDLQNNVFTALRVLGKGFVESNNLTIDPGDDERLDELKEQSLVLLYRLMFILYAESRHLINPDDPVRRKEYDNNFSLDQLRLGIIDTVGEAATTETFASEYSEHSTTMWARLENLFALIDSGEESLGIPPYNGGLFDDAQHEFLTENGVADRYLAEVIYRLSTTETKDGFVPADYADLDTRHLGTIYEGLLEHEFRIAPSQYAAVAEDGGQVWKDAADVSVAEAVETVDEGSLYVVNDDGERKSTGAYYTPDYVVTYIVEETVDPLIEDIDEELAATNLEPGTQEYVAAFWKRVKQLKVLDPAMGSGHFLTKATGYIAEQVMERVRELETATLFDEQQVRREVSRECIYGVDLNGMAVELAKLSMWLETLATDQPLAFLDHHLKAGNSLVGSDINAILSTGDEGPSGQTTLGDWMEQTRQQALGHVMDLMQDLLAIDNETLSDIKSMEEIYAEIRDDPLYQHLFEMASVHTAAEFGLDVPDDADEQMAKALRDESWSEVSETDWFRSAQAIAGDEQFFHWELEFPEVFFGDDGNQRLDSGFDAVVSNPPYIRGENLRKAQSEFVGYMENRYETATGRFDIYAPFVQQGSRLAAQSNLSYILPNKFFQSGGGKPLRQFLIENGLLQEIVDFSQYQVFDDVTTYTCILSLFNGDGQFDYARVSKMIEGESEIRDLDRVVMDSDELGYQPWALSGANERKVLKKMEKTGEKIGQISEYTSQGIKSGDNDVFFVEVRNWGEEIVTVRSHADNAEYELERELVRPLVHGEDIKRYSPLEPDLGVIYPYETKKARNEIINRTTLENKYPLTKKYLDEFQNRLSNRAESQKFNEWYALSRPREKQLFESPKLLIPDVCQRSEFSLDESGEIYVSDSAYVIVLQSDLKSMRNSLLAVLNSSVTWFYIYQTSSILRGDFRRFKTSYLDPLPIPKLDPNEYSEGMVEHFEDVYDEFEQNGELQKIEDSDTFLSYLGDRLLETYDQRHSLNLTLLDHLGINPKNNLTGPEINKIGLTQPPKGAGNSILHETTKTRKKLKIEQTSVERKSVNTVEIKLTARYKPENPDDHDTDQYDYTETEFLPALRITDLTEMEANLIEAFVPVAIDEAGGFAEFRKNATQTNSLIDRLKKLTLPDVTSVEDGLKNYIRTRERAEELDEKIERTEKLINEIVYDLYDLTDEEIETVEAAIKD